MTILQAVFFICLVSLSIVITWIIFNHQEAIQRIRKRFMRKMGFYVVVMMMLISTPLAQEPPPTIGAGTDEDHPIVLDLPALVSSGESLLGWAEQAVWSGPQFLARNESLPANVTRVRFPLENIT
jgi:hypothetical protein